MGKTFEKRRNCNEKHPFERGFDTSLRYNGAILFKSRKKRKETVMFCNNCGAQLVDGASFCGSCGSAVVQAAAPASNVVEPQAQPGFAPQPQQPQAQPGFAPQQPQPGYQQAPNYAAPQPMPVGQPAAVASGNLIQQKCAQATADGHPMKWYKWLIWGMLPLTALFQILGSIAYLTGSIWDASLAAEGISNGSRLMYSIYPAVHTVDMVYGILSIAVGALAIFTLLQLRKFKKNAPLFVYAVYAASAAISLVYALGLAAAVSGLGVESSTVGSIVGCVVAVILNKMYFDKRAAYFTE